MADISKIKLPGSEQIYDIKDLVAREKTSKLPDLTCDTPGTAIIYDGTNWSKQSGYGYTKSGVTHPINSDYIPVATTSAIGGVKIDGTTIVINNGVISSANQITVVNFTLPASGWTLVDGKYNNTVNVSGMTSGSVGSVSLAMNATDAQYEAGVLANMRCIEQGTGTITMRAYNQPTIDIPCTFTFLSSGAFVQYTGESEDL